MKTAKPKKQADYDDEPMKPHYNFSKGEKPNYAKRFPGGAVITIKSSNGTRHKQVEVTSMVVLDTDLSKVFPDGQSVNAALRHLICSIAE